MTPSGGGERTKDEVRRSRLRGGAPAWRPLLALALSLPACGCGAPALRDVVGEELGFAPLGTRVEHLAPTTVIRMKPGRPAFAVEAEAGRCVVAREEAPATLSVRNLETVDSVAGGVGLDVLGLPASLDAAVGPRDYEVVVGAARRRSVPAADLRAAMRALPAECRHLAEDTAGVFVVQAVLEVGALTYRFRADRRGTSGARFDAAATALREARWSVSWDGEDEFVMTSPPGAWYVAGILECAVVKGPSGEARLEVRERTETEGVLVRE